MESAAVLKNPFFRNFEQLDTKYDRELCAAWFCMKSKPRPCYTPALLKSILEFQNSVVCTNSADSSQPIQYVISSSKVLGVYNLGGDLDLFRKLINERDREGLYRYGRACIDVLYNNAVSLNQPITTIALVQGSALGGGFEAALSFNVIIAERSSEFGFPEILFNLFPGMGAFSLLSRKIGIHKAEEMITSGRIYSAEELYDLGVIDVLVNDGDGEIAVRNFIKRHRRSRNGLVAMQKVRQKFDPLTYEELDDIVSIWADAAMGLERKDLRLIEKLVSAQSKLNSEKPPVKKDDEKELLELTV